MSAHTYRSNLPVHVRPQIPRNLVRGYEALALINCYLADSANSQDFEQLRNALNRYLALPEGLRMAVEDYEKEHMLIP